MRRDSSSLVGRTVRPGIGLNVLTGAIRTQWQGGHGNSRCWWVLAVNSSDFSLYADDRATQDGKRPTAQNSWWKQERPGRMPRSAG